MLLLVFFFFQSGFASDFGCVLVPVVVLVLNHILLLAVTLVLVVVLVLFLKLDLVSTKN